MVNCPVIIIGGGIGGLTTAAYLAKHNISCMLLEQNRFVGGRCSTRTIMGHKFEIGALYIGGGVFDHLRHTFGIECHSIPVRAAVKIVDKFVSFPIDFRHLQELWLCGTPWYAIVNYLIRSQLLKSNSFLSNFESAGDALNFLSSDKRIQKFLFSIISVSGLSPFRMPSNILSGKSEAAQYRSINPEMLVGGNSWIAILLTDIFNNKCDLKFNQKVKKIIIKDGKAVGVETDEGIYLSQIVVSNVGIKDTVLFLTDQSVWESRYLARVQEARESLMAVNVFMILMPGYRFLNFIPHGVTTLFMPYNVTKEFEMLEKGQFPEKSMFILHLPSNVERLGGDSHPATLQFYYPRAQVDPDRLKRQVDMIMQKGLSDLMKGLPNLVTDYVVYDPMLYKEKFGFSPKVFSISPELGSNRFSIQTPVENLFCVGDSVEPEGPCVAQAMASGIKCAQRIIKLLE